MFDQDIALWKDAWGTVSSRWDRFENWLIANDDLFNTLTIYTLAAGFFLFFIVKGVTYLVVRYQRPQTDVGVALSTQKARETVMFFLLTLVFFGFPLLPLGIWERVILRILLHLSIAGAGVAGIRFMVALRREEWGRVIVPETKDERDTRQDLVRDQQTETGVLQAETTLINTSRARILSNAGVLLSEEQVRQESTRREQGREGARQDAIDVAQDAREGEQDVRETEQDQRDNGKVEKGEL